ncbi:MAG: YfdX family protein [Thiobacillus sp.]|nr:YfdX family protein [Thiobacillus sp.]
MKTVSKPRTRLMSLSLALLLASSGVWAGAPASGSNPPPPAAGESAYLISESGWANPHLARAAAISGQALLEHLQSARAFLAAGSPEGARDALFTANEFTRAMERTMPFMAVADDVESARNKLISGEEDVFYDDLLPICSSVDDMQVYAPKLAQHVRGKVRKAEAQAHRGHTRAAAKTLREVSEEITQTTVYLPLGYVDDQIQVAMSALKADSPDKAQVAVDRALSSLVEHQYTVLDVPRT